MSVLGADIHNVLTQLLTGLSSSENDVRSRAEEQLNTEWVAGRPDVLLMGLVEQMHDSPDPSVRHAGLFRCYIYGSNLLTLDCRRGRLQLCFSVEWPTRHAKCRTRVTRQSCS